MNAEMFDEGEREVIKHLGSLLQTIERDINTLNITEMISYHDAWKIVIQAHRQLEGLGVKHYDIYLSFYSAVNDFLNDTITTESDSVFQQIITTTEKESE